MVQFEAYNDTIYRNDINAIFYNKHKVVSIILND